MQFSFCSYDCGPDRPPNFSSTSPHSALDFHRAKDWFHFLAPSFFVTRPEFRIMTFSPVSSTSKVVVHRGGSIAFLLSAAAGFITGTNLPADGGYTAN